MTLREILADIHALEPEQSPSIRRSTVTFIRRGASLARVAGDVYFDHDIRVVIRERLA